MYIEEQKARLKTDTSGVNHKAPGSLEALPNAHAILGVLTSEQLLCSRMCVCSSGEAATAFLTHRANAPNRTLRLSLTNSYFDERSHLELERWLRG